MKLCMFLRQTEVTTNREIKRNVDNSQLYRALFNSLLQLISLDDRIFVCDFFSGYWSIVVIYCIVYAGLSNPIDFIGIYCHIDNGKKKCRFGGKPAFIRMTIYPTPTNIYIQFITKCKQFQYIFSPTTENKKTGKNYGVQNSKP